jgi:Tfp pilus assembly protein PilF
MSLIMDALKKAHQLRLKEPKGTPLPSSPLSDSKKSLRGLGKRWVVIGIGLASLIIFALIFWRLFSPPSTSIPIRTADRIEKKAPAPIEDKKPQAPSKGVLSPESIEGPKDILSSSKDAPSVVKETASLSEAAPSVSKDVLSMSKDVPSSPKDTLRLSKGPQIEKSPPKIEPSIKEKREAPPIKQMVAEQKIKQTSPPTPSPPASLKEKAPAKSIEVKPEGEKDRSFSSEILTQFNLGVKLSNQREFQKAIQAYQKVIELDSTYVEAYNNLGIVYQEMGDFDRAFGAYQKSIEINPQYEKGYNNLGIILYLKGHHEEAIEAFQKALTINSNNIESHINLGVLFKKQGQLNKAIESYQKALEINPLHKEIHYNIALLFEQLENVELAIGHYKQFIKLSSTSHPDLVLRVQRHVDELIKAREKKK